MGHITKNKTRIISNRNYSLQNKKKTIKRGFGNAIWLIRNKSKEEQEKEIIDRRKKELEGTKDLCKLHSIILLMK